MSLDADLKRALAEMGKAGIETFPAVVTSVNEDSKTITITDIDELEYENVRLAAAEDTKKSVVTFPKVNSTVLVTRIGNDDNTLFVSKVNEVDKIEGTIETVNFKVDSLGYKITKGDQNLLTILNDMIDELNKIKVIQGRTINVAAMTAIKNRLNTVLTA